MTGGSRRQWYLLALLGVAIIGYFRFGTGAAGITAAAEVGALPPIDADGLVRSLRGVSTVNPQLAIVARGDSDPDRNLFQYGERRPPPPPPMTEAERKAAEERLKAQEAAARAAAQQAQIDAEKRQAELIQQQQQPPPDLVPPPPPRPLAPPKPQPPPMNFKFMGMLGPAKKKVGVFLEGEKMMLARKGEVLDGKFRVIEIGAEWAWVGYVDPAFKDEKKRIDFGL